MTGWVLITLSSPAFRCSPIFNRRPCREEIECDSDVKKLEVGIATTFRHQNCVLLSVASDGEEGNGSVET